MAYDSKIHSRPENLEKSRPITGIIFLTRKTAKNAISRKNFFDLFDFTSFLAWTFLNFLAHCVVSGVEDLGGQRRY